MKRPYGFFEVEVTTPDYLEHPVLQTRVKTEGGYTTMSPLGTWTDVYSKSITLWIILVINSKYLLIR